jgi:hypothetical protein
MSKRGVMCLTAALSVLILVSLVSTSFAQDANFDPSHARFVTLPMHPNPYAQPAVPGVQLPQWTFSWKSSYNNENYNSVIIGTDPSQNNTTTTIKWGIIPIKMVFGPDNGNMTFDPNTAKYYKNYSATQMIADSLLFNPLVDYNQGGTDLGKTQYEDAYQRGNFWGYGVKTNTDYHLLFGKVVIAPEQTFNVPTADGDVYVNPQGIAGGATIGVADINWFDSQLQGVMAKLKEIQPDTLPVFITYNVYLSDGQPFELNCCIGGYHSANGPQPAGQTYSYATTVTQNPNARVFSQDISALTHELGEWIMDPFVDNPSPCPSNSILEVGDPLETGPNFGDYPYTVDGFTFHPQDLVFITWFGAPATTSLDTWNGNTEDVVTFQNETLNVCQTAP